MKKLRTFLSLLLVALFTFGVITPKVSAKEMKTKINEDGRVQIILEFDDVEEAKWAAEFIAKMKAKNVISGYPDGTFRPNQPVSRVEAIVMAVRLMGLEKEAQAKSAESVKLHFKDAALLEKQYPWAKGYVITALEKGLFDTTEEKIQPDKPATRVWVSSLLVRALGLQADALKQMTKIPVFKDADSIPAGAIGYINVALEQGIIAGYPDNTFKPYKSVTRAEMAALLDKTGNGLLENTGAVTVYGTITDINFVSISVTDRVYEATTGTVTVRTFAGDSATYFIPADLMVQNKDGFIRANQLAKGDVVTLVIKDNKVIEAYLLDKETVENTEPGILKLEVQVDTGEGREYKLEYKNEKGKVYGEVKEEQGKENDEDENEDNGDKNNEDKNNEDKNNEDKNNEDKNNEEKNKENIALVKELVEKMALTSEMTKQEIADRVLSVLEIDENAVKELEIEVRFANGKKVEIDIEKEKTKQAEEKEDEEMEDDD
ncbi:S-layer homology domain-containing protein [Thermincola ferriacetica]